MAAEEAAVQTDVMLVVGTSAVVYPAAGLIEMAVRSRARLIVVNAEPLDLGIGLELVGRAAEILPTLLSLND
jgi:NAD-dependent SIR2 family protein deacetylase